MVHTRTYFYSKTCSEENNSWLTKKNPLPPICGALILTAFALPLSLCPTP